MRTNAFIRAGLLLVVTTSAGICGARADGVPVTADARAAVIGKFDKDGDGRLSDKERESMRQAIFATRLREAQAGRGRGGFQFPPEIVEKYDKDGDGRLNDEESEAARNGLRQMFEELQRKYDANRNGRLDPEEMERVQEDAAAGKLEGVPRFFLQMRPRRGPRDGRTGVSMGELLQRADKDRDGRLSAEELEAARAELSRQNPPAPNRAP